MKMTIVMMVLMKMIVMEMIMVMTVQVIMVFARQRGYWWYWTATMNIMTRIILIDDCRVLIIYFQTTRSVRRCVTAEPRSWKSRAKTGKPIQIVWPIVHISSVVPIDAYGGTFFIQFLGRRTTKRKVAIWRSIDDNDRTISRRYRKNEQNGERIGKNTWFCST